MQSEFQEKNVDFSCAILIWIWLIQGCVYNFVFWTFCIDSKWDLDQWKGNQAEISKTLNNLSKIRTEFFVFVGGFFCVLSVQVQTSLELVNAAGEAFWVWSFTVPRSGIFLRVQHAAGGKSIFSSNEQKHESQHQTCSRCFGFDVYIW